MDGKADNTSLDSLSFTGLVCVHDQQSKLAQSKSPLNNRANQIHRPDPEFEFSTASTAHNSNRTAPADMSISTNQHLPHAFLSQLLQSPVTNQPFYKGSLPATQSHRKRSSNKYNNSRKVSDKTDHDLRSHSYRDQSVRSSRFGEKLLKSFVSPCRGCQAIQPTVKTLPRPDVKLH